MALINEIIGKLHTNKGTRAKHPIRATVVPDRRAALNELQMLINEALNACINISIYVLWLDNSGKVGFSRATITT